jgi:hypothetical protein
MNIESVTNPKRGGITPINVQDPRRIGRFKAVGSESSPQDFPTMTVSFMQPKGTLPQSLVAMGECRTTFYEVSGDCKDPSDFLNGWSDYVKILSNGKATSITEGGGSFDSDSGVMDDVDFTLESSYLVGSLGFGEKAAVEIYSEVIDITYLSREQCPGCGPEDDGTQVLYAVTNNTVASAGEAPSMVYSLDGGATWTELAITGAASTDVPRAIDVVAGYVVIVYDDGAGGGYWASQINNITGVPSSTWSDIVAGFVSGNEPQDIYVESPADIWFVGDGGYIYKSTDLLSGVSVIDAGNATSNDLNRIDGFGETLVAVGASGTVIYSTNSGTNWATTDNNPGADSPRS